MSARDYLETELKRLIEKARVIVAEAADSGRNLTDTERLTIEGYISESNELKRRIADIKHQEELLRVLEGQNEARDIDAEMDAMEAYKKAIEDEGL